MNLMWSPWRSKYIESFKEESVVVDTDSCIFCNAINSGAERNEELLVVNRMQNCIVMLNKYPYNNGHLMIAPLRHLGDFEDLSESEMTDIMLTVQKSIKILKKTLKPHAFNIGANLGREAGAGVPGHIHFHVVPRWNGDMSFMPVIADVKVVSQAMEDNLKEISKAFQEILSI